MARQRHPERRTGSSGPAEQLVEGSGHLVGDALRQTRGPDRAPLRAEVQPPAVGAEAGAGDLGDVLSGQPENAVTYYRRFVSEYYGDQRRYAVQKKIEAITGEDESDR